MRSEIILNLLRFFLLGVLKANGCANTRKSASQKRRGVMELLATASISVMKSSVLAATSRKIVSNVTEFLTVETAATRVDVMCAATTNGFALFLPRMAASLSVCLSKTDATWTSVVPGVRMKGTA